MPQHGRHGHGHVAELISGSNAHHRVKSLVSISDSLAGAAAIIFTIVHLVHNRMAPSSRGSREVLINPTFEKKSTIPLPSFLQLTARPHLRWQSEALMGNAESCCYTGADQPIIIEFQALNCHKGLTLTVGSWPQLAVALYGGSAERQTTADTLGLVGASGQDVGNVQTRSNPFPRSSH